MQEIKPQDGPVRQNEILLRDEDTWLHFSRPYRVVTAHVLAEVLPALQEIEQMVQRERWHAAGFLSYESAPAFDPALRAHTPGASMTHRLAEGTDFPFLWFGLYPTPRVVTLPEPQTFAPVLEWLPPVDRPAYNRAIEHIKRKIALGQTYQVNYTMRLQAEFKASAWDFFLRLVRGQNQCAAYVDTGRHVICSASPELFFHLDGDRITCRPMKGTVQRGRTTAEDRERGEWLKNSEKNRAENVMIVDMFRNDLGRIADTGSVNVLRLFQTERYPTLWQMTSTVTARTGASVAEIFTALFPCASITGAPKVSTMRIIAELENTPRNIYTGSIGYLAPERQAKFNVAIRTVLVDREREQAEYGVGGGIVWDSTSREEYAEALLKARILTDEPAHFALLETMLWTPEAGFFLRAKHVARMLESAEYFEISISRQKLEGHLEQISSDFRTPQRVRLLLDRAGKLHSESSDFELTPARTVRSACLARHPVDSSQVFLYHKTTNREIYDSARQSSDEFDDVLLYNEWDELTEFTIGNLVVELDGKLYTPPIACGVLPGTFRAHLLETGQVRERTIRLDELKDCSQVFRVNSVRSWQAVHVHSHVKKIL